MGSCRPESRPRSFLLRDPLHAQIAAGVAQAERGERVDGDEGLERLRRELIDRHGRD